MKILRTLVLLFVTACSSGFLGAPNGATRFHPPMVYETWYEDLESCAGIVGNFGAIRWYYADVLIHPVDGSLLDGYNRGNIIIIKDTSLDDITLVRHEMLHHILQGDYDHESQWWRICGEYDDPPPRG